MVVDTATRISRLEAELTKLKEEREAEERHKRELIGGIVLDHGTAQLRDELARLLEEHVKGYADRVLLGLPVTRRPGRPSKRRRDTDPPPAR